MTRLTAKTRWDQARRLRSSVSRDADGREVGGDSSAGRDTAETWHRELRRSDPGAERPGSPVARSIPCLRTGARARLRSDQYRSDRGHAGRDRGQLARLRAGTIALAPDSVTIYQMELLYNTTISGDLLKGTGRFTEPVANWSTKRRWVGEAFAALEAAGYHARSAYTLVKSPATRFIYTNSGVVGRQTGGARCRIVWSRGRRAHAESRHVGYLRWGDRAWRASACQGLSTDDRGAADPRFHPQLKRGSLVPETFGRPMEWTCSSGFAVPLETLTADGFSPKPVEIELPSRARGRCAWTSCCGGSSCPST